MLIRTNNLIIMNNLAD